MGADANAIDNFDTTPLHLAVKSHKHLSLIRLLVENGADVDVQASFYRYNSLMFAARSGRLDIIEYLVNDCGAQLGTVARERTAVSIAQFNGRADAAASLVRGMLRRGSDLIFHPCS